MRRARRLDLVEAFAGTAVGFALSWALTVWALPWWGLAPSAVDALGITALFTAASVARGYAVRRVFRRLEGLALRRRGGCDA